MDFMWTVWSNEVDLDFCGYHPLAHPTKELMKELGL